MPYMPYGGGAGATAVDDAGRRLWISFKGQDLA